jgi:F0F1-type ATP synthase assembly protein I
MAVNDGSSDGPGKTDPGFSGPGMTQGFEIAAGIGLGVLLGMWWDKHHGSAPWGLLIGLLIGCAAGTYLLIKESMRANKD